MCSLSLMNGQYLLSFSILAAQQPFTSLRMASKVNDMPSFAFCTLLPFSLIFLNSVHACFSLKHLLKGKGWHGCSREYKLFALRICYVIPFISFQWFSDFVKLINIKGHLHVAFTHSAIFAHVFW